eukprot:6492806-Amphidinium_carterae.2
MSHITLPETGTLGLRRDPTLIHQPLEAQTPNDLTKSTNREGGWGRLGLAGKRTATSGACRASDGSSSGMPVESQASRLPSLILYGPLRLEHTIHAPN